MQAWKSDIYFLCLNYSGTHSLPCKTGIVLIYHRNCYFWVCICFMEICFNSVWWFKLFLWFASLSGIKDTLSILHSIHHLIQVLIKILDQRLLRTCPYKLYLTRWHPRSAKFLVQRMNRIISLQPQGFFTFYRFLYLHWHFPPYFRRVVTLRWTNFNIVIRM